MSIDKLLAWHNAAVDKAKGTPASPAPVGDGLVKRLLDLAKDFDNWTSDEIFGPSAGSYLTYEDAKELLTTAAATITRLEQRERELVEGLRFFAEEADRYEPYENGDDIRVWDSNIQLVHLRRARDLLKDTKP